MPDSSMLLPEAVKTAKNGMLPAAWTDCWGMPPAPLPPSALAPALERLSSSALAHLRAGADGGQFALWKSHTMQSSDSSDDEMFASEAAFASAARILLELRLGNHGQAAAFPHLYGELFGWFEPSDDQQTAVREAFEAALTDDRDALNWLYQFSIPESVRKRYGQFYTRPPIVRLQLGNVGFDGRAALSGRLIDPACGAGAYLTEAAGRVLAAAQDVGLSPAETYDAVRGAIHGLDLNALGVLLTEAALALLLVPTIQALPEGVELMPLHLYVTDSLRRGELSAADSYAQDAEDLKALEGEFAGGFRWVVGNPPYAKFPSRLFSAEQQRRFAKTTYGHPNLYGLFLQAGVELLADDGRLCFITPKSYVSGLYFRNLRQFLNSEVQIERFDGFTTRTGVFEGVLQEFLIITARRSGESPAHIALREYEGQPNGAPACELRAPRSSVMLGEAFDNAYFTSPNALAHRVLDAMTTGSRPLHDLGYSALTGTIVWNRLKEHVRDSSADDNLPLVWGNGVRMFRFLRLGNREGSASHMALVDRTTNIISRGPALLVKRMTAKEESRRIVACRAPDELANSPRGYFAENHVNIVRQTNGATPAIPLDAVLGLLNSALFDYMFRALNGNTQVSASELEMLPVREGPQLARIADLAAQLTDSGATDTAAFVELNRLVFELYGVGEDDAAALVKTS